ncbi:hypothetical protein ACOTTU_24110 [Roseobacter sp. EG26]|uniref:hypothetical protein n=1 Tax=Roseobacter sp. EG26 TaxID=3412477 RepID=UPI003CE5C00D
MVSNSNFRRAVTAICLVGASTLPAYADIDWVVYGPAGVSPSMLEVKSNGENYTVLKTNSTVNFKGHFKYDAGNLGRIKNWKIWPKLENGAGIHSEVPSLESFAGGKSYSSGQRPKTVDQFATMKVPASALNANAVAMCNFHAQKMRDQGKSNNEIFSQNYDLFFRVSVAYSIDLTISANSLHDISNDNSAKYTVRCGKSNVQSPVTINSAQLKLKQTAALNGKCKVELKTIVGTDQPGAKLKYRILHSSGNKSNPFTATTDITGLGVQINQIKIPNGSGPETGWFRVQGVSHDFTTNKAHYQMNCSAGNFGFKGADAPKSLGKATPVPAKPLGKAAHKPAKPLVKKSNTPKPSALRRKQ